MKLFIPFLFLLVPAARAQRVGIGTATPHASAVLDVRSTQAGLLPPRLSSFQRDNIADPATGLVVFNTTEASLQVFDGKYWQSLQPLRHASWGSQELLVYPGSGDIANSINGTGSNGNGFGNALAGRQQLVLAGASNESHSDVNNAGAVYLYNMEGASRMPKPLLKITAPQPLADSKFGHSVSLGIDAVLVGEPQAGNFDEGRAHLYSFVSPPFVSANHLATITQPEGPEAGAEFGAAVAVDGNHFLVGAPGARNGSGLNTGKVFFFSKNGNGVQHVASFSRPGGAGGDQFGEAVALSGNVAAVAAPWAETNNINDNGAVHLYVRSAGVWSHSAVLLPPVSSGSYFRFGHSLFLQADTLLVGALGSTNGGGKVFLYHRVNGSWTPRKTFDAPGGAGEHFGASVHYLNGQVLVGAAQAEVDGLPTIGKAYLYSSPSSMVSPWTNDAVFTHQQTNSYALFGHAVWLLPSGALVGCPRFDLSSATDVGRVYFFPRR